MQILKDQRGNAVLIVVIVLLLAAAGFIYFSSQNKEPAAPAPATENEAMMEEKVSPVSLAVFLEPEDGFMQEDSVILTGENGTSRVLVNLATTADVPQPLHIHSGTCENLGGIVYPLSDIVGGTSETLLPLSLFDLQDQFPLAVNAHKSADELDVYVACGDLVSQEAMMEAEGDAMMVEKGETKTFNLTGVNFAFSQQEIRVNKGDTVKIVFTASEGFHDWIVDEFNAATDRVTDGETAEVEFVASEAGTFEYYCSVGNHRQLGMTGNLIVE